MGLRELGFRGKVEGVGQQSSPLEGMAWGAPAQTDGFPWAQARDVTSPRTLAPLQNGDMEGMNWY